MSNYHRAQVIPGCEPLNMGSLPEQCLPLTAELTVGFSYPLLKCAFVS